VAADEVEVEEEAVAGAVAADEVGWVVGVVTWEGLQATATLTDTHTRRNFFMLGLILE
jgi:hypothetical protein